MSNLKAICQKRRDYSTTPWSSCLCGDICPCNACASTGVQPQPQSGFHRLRRAGFMLKQHEGTSLRAAELGLPCTTPSTLFAASLCPS